MSTQHIDAMKNLLFLTLRLLLVETNPELVNDQTPFPIKQLDGRSVPVSLRRHGTERCDKPLKGQATGLTIHTADKKTK